MKQHDAFDFLFAEHSSLLEAHRTLCESISTHISGRQAERRDPRRHMSELQQLRDAVAEHRYALRNHRFALQLIRERIVSFEA